MRSGPPHVHASSHYFASTPSYSTLSYPTPSTPPSNLPQPARCPRSPCSSPPRWLKSELLSLKLPNTNADRARPCSLQWLPSLPVVCTLTSKPSAKPSQVQPSHYQPASCQTALPQPPSGKTPVLIASTVVEVGIDEPEASVMLVENAKCFGMAQLHQLRGRVGRGARDSRCYLMVAEGDVEGQMRLEVMEQSRNGLHIAEADLRARWVGFELGRVGRRITCLCASCQDVLHFFRPPSGGEWNLEVSRRISARGSCPTHVVLLMSLVGPSSEALFFPPAHSILAQARCKRLLPAP